jgi:hypothetical protein
MVHTFSYQLRWFDHSSQGVEETRESAIPTESQTGSDWNQLEPVANSSKDIT